MMDDQHEITGKALDDPLQAGDIPGDVSYVRQVYWIAFWSNLGLAIFKIAVGALGYSRLLIIDGLNSASAALLITIMLFGLHISRPQTISRKYPYGMGKAQFLFTILLGFIIAVGASVILAISIKTFFISASLEPIGIGLATALVSLGGNLILFLFLKQAGSIHKKEEFQRISHLQSINVASSIILFSSLGLSGLFGWYIAERVGSITIALTVVWLSIRIIKTSLDGIMDRSSGKEIELRIKALVGSIDNVANVKWVRTRRVGQNLHAELLLGLKGDFTIRQTDQVAAQVRKHLFSKLKGTLHVVELGFYPV